MSFSKRKFSQYCPVSHKPHTFPRLLSREKPFLASRVGLGCSLALPGAWGFWQTWEICQVRDNTPAIRCLPACPATLATPHTATKPLNFGYGVHAC